ncbi:putative ribonuclease H-like domain-containing protein [Tanacetum coccineum]
MRVLLDVSIAGINVVCYSNSQVGAVGIWFLSQKGSGGERGVKEKKHGSANDGAKDSDCVTKFTYVVSSEDTTKDTVVVSPVRAKPVLSSSGGHAVEKVIGSRNNKGTQEENVGQTPIISTVDPNLDTSADVAVPLESNIAISQRFGNTAYGFFLGKRVAYPVVANCVRNTWGKYRLVKSILNSSIGLFFFQFNSMDGLDAFLENGPWFIRNNPLILKNEDGLNVIATKLGTPLMLDSYTYDMCMQSWGRSSYARRMIELRDDVELKDNIMVAMPKLVGEGFCMCNIRVEYE